MDWTSVNFVFASERIVTEHLLFFLIEEGNSIFFASLMHESKKCDIIISNLVVVYYIYI